MIIVIGATSFIGVHTVTELVNQGCEVLVTGRKDRFKEHYEALGVKYVNLDLDKVAKTEHSHPLGMVVSTHFRCGKGVKRGLKNGALPFKID